MLERRGRDLGPAQRFGAISNDLVTVSSYLTWPSHVGGCGWGVGGIAPLGPTDSRVTASVRVSASTTPTRPMVWSTQTPPGGDYSQEPDWRRGGESDSRWATGPQRVSHSTPCGSFR